MKRTLIFTVLIACMAALGNLNAQNSALTPELMWQMKRIGNPVVSPDGQWSAFVVSETKMADNSSDANIFIVNNETGQTRQITRCGKAGSPTWSPDSRSIAFTSRRGEGPSQLFIISIDGGEAFSITNMPVGIYSPKWFPDGKRVAFVANVLPEYGSNIDTLKFKLDLKKKQKVSVKATEDRIYRYWDRWLTDGLFPHIFIVDIETKKVTDLMPGSERFFGMMGGASYSISPNGQTIALSANSSRPPYIEINPDIFLLPVDGSGTMENITTNNPADDSDPRFSPDGRYLLYGRQNRTDFYADNVQMVVYDLTTKNSRNITKDLDISCQDWQWSVDGKTIFFTAEDKGMQPIYSISTQGGKPKELFRYGNNTGASPAKDKYIIFSHNNLNSPAELYRLDLKTNKETKLTTFSNELLAKVKMGKVENIIYKGANGADVQMFAVYPIDFDPTKKYPLVVLIHGGPHGAFGDQWHYRWNAHLFAAPGYIAIMPNFHGSTGFGQDFAISIHGNHSDKPFEDIMKAVDYMVAKGFVDEKRMAATGGSYGGYMVSWIAGHTNRFAALVNHAGVFDLYSQFGSDFTANRETAYGGTPWENFEKMQLHNPAMFASNFKSPMLIMHGELDYRVPVGQALTVYGIYKGMGLDARLVYFPDENHWILKPQNSIFWYKELYNWLERYLK
jgi:dipeptidyl aminopeptidase/acylaminoacyl peptidase